MSCVTANFSKIALQQKLVKVLQVKSRKQRNLQMTAQLQEQQKTIVTKKLVAEPVTKEAFAPFGQLCAAQEDGKVFDQDDAQLDLSQGTPRLYVMRLHSSGLKFDRITHHAKVTQCLGSLNPPSSWYLCVCEAGKMPCEDNIKAFKVPHGVFLKLEAGTWHAGPYFHQAEWVDFFNLELENTNVVDHNTVNFGEEGYNFEIIDKQ
eukprot:TRINITY_DN9905_c0_g1_i1.p1 TRINITY_DN9905_c0_g1~~TRINITY_DN9905_c0_g1_i1.p1  ORF type:complete len:205 (+),score=31.18 TRINITY_DN9905_c0_g1_i1:94-708(+)